MADYGVTPAGFARKPLPVIKAELEAALRTQFGPDLILTPQSPMGQIVGVFSDYVAEMWEQLEAVYQSHDPDQAEATQLDTLARLRNLYRNDLSDEDLRQAITNADRGSVDVQDIAAAAGQIAGVTFSRVYVNNRDEADERGLPGGRVAIVAEGGDSGTIADTLRRFVAPGIALFGNTYIDSVADGYCRSIPIVRPVVVPVTVEIAVRTRRDQADCPPPALAALRQDFAAAWAALRENGRDVSFYTVRQIIEAANPAVEVVTVEATRPDMEPPGVNATVAIDFTEIAEIALDDLTVVAA